MGTQFPPPTEYLTFLFQNQNKINVRVSLGACGAERGGKAEGEPGEGNTESANSESNTDHTTIAPAAIVSHTASNRGFLRTSTVVRLQCNVRFSCLLQALQFLPAIYLLLVAFTHCGNLDSTHVHLPLPEVSWFRYTKHNAKISKELTNGQ